MADTELSEIIIQESMAFLNKATGHIHQIYQLKLWSLSLSCGFSRKDAERNTVSKKFILFLTPRYWVFLEKLTVQMTL
jgi:hypothetical protein